MDGWTHNTGESIPQAPNVLLFLSTFSLMWPPKVTKVAVISVCIKKKSWPSICCWRSILIFWYFCYFFSLLFIFIFLKLVAIARAKQHEIDWNTHIEKRKKSHWIIKRRRRRRERRKCVPCKISKNPKGSRTEVQISYQLK